MNKTAITIIIILCVAIGFGWIYLRSTATGDPIKNPETHGWLCYEYQQEATAAAPYAVDEQIRIQIDNGRITGTKQGTQSGPDMTNGYAGTLTGTIKDEMFTGVFDYVVEGSQNREQEEYQVAYAGWSKYRYPLKESDGMLVPDKKGTVTILPYFRTDCPTEN